jgi:hypothetical protein
MERGSCSSCAKTSWVAAFCWPSPICRDTKTHTQNGKLSKWKMVHTKTFHPNLLPGLQFISFVNPYNYNRLTTVALPVKHWPNLSILLIKRRSLSVCASVCARSWEPGPEIEVSGPRRTGPLFFLFFFFLFFFFSFHPKLSSSTDRFFFFFLFFFPP